MPQIKVDTPTVTTARAMQCCDDLPYALRLLSKATLVHFKEDFFTQSMNLLGVQRGIERCYAYFREHDPDFDASLTPEIRRVMQDYASEQYKKNLQ